MEDPGFLSLSLWGLERGVIMENALWIIGAMHHHICTLDGHWDLPSTNVSVKSILLINEVSCVAVSN
jgi:hypothetical protein